MFNLDIFLGSRPEIYAEAKSLTRRSHWDVKRSAAIWSEFVCSIAPQGADSQEAAVCALLLRCQLHRGLRQSCASTLNRWLAGPTFPYCDPAVTLQRSPNLHWNNHISCFFNQIWSCKFDCNELLRFFRTCSLCVWSQCLHKSVDPFHPH